MTPIIILLIVVVLLLALLAAEVPVAFALALSGTLGVILLKSASVATSTMAAAPFQATAKYGLVVAPMFILMGLLVMHSGMAEDVFAVANRIVGRRIPGGLAVASVMACAGFAAVTGSSVATVATIGRMSIREMTRNGYSATFTAGVVGAAGTLGILIPPSIALVIYGVLTGESIGLLLIAGIVPGVLSAILYTLSIVIRVRVQGEKILQTSRAQEMEAQITGRTAVSALLSVLLLFTIVVGGIYTGVFTATEAGAVGAFAALFILVIRLFRDPKNLLRKLGEALRETASLTSMIFMLLVGGFIFTFFLVAGGLPTAFTEWILSLPISPHLVVAVFLLAMIPLGMVLDGLSILLITIPLAYPVVAELGFNGIWFGILTVKMIEFGLITPPIGINIYVVAGVSEGKISVEEAFRGAIPFMLVDLATILIFFAFPGLVTWLPELAAV